MRYLLNDPTSWAFDLSYLMYGAVFYMAGAYTLSRGGHVRADMFYRKWRPRTQAMVELVLYVTVLLSRHPGAGGGRWRLRLRVDAPARGQRQQPGRRADLAVEDDDPVRRRVDRAAGLGRGVALRASACARATGRRACTTSKNSRPRSCSSMPRRTPPRRYNQERPHERSRYRAGDARHPGLHHLHRLSGRLHADGARRGLRLLRLLPGRARPSSTTASSTC